MFRKLSKIDVNAVRDLSKKYNILTLDKDLSDKGFVGIVYTPEVLTEIINNELSFGHFDENNNLSGYFLMVSQDGFKNTFGTELPELTQKYDLSYIKNSSYAPQGCIDEKLRGRGIYKQLQNKSCQEALRQKITGIYGEILTNPNNPSSIQVHEKIGWNMIAIKEDSSLYSFKGCDQSVMKQLEKTQFIDNPVVWGLFYKKIKE